MSSRALRGYTNLKGMLKPFKIHNLQFTIILVFVALNVFGQPDSGFTNKAEAKNLIVNGKKEGKWCEYNKQRSFDHSHEDDTISYDLTVYKAGKVNGIMREYYMSGKIEAEMRFRDNHQYGVYKAYYESGKLEVDGFYNNNFQLDGVYTKYYENGKVKMRIVYSNGLNKEEKNYDENGNEIK